MHIRVVMLGTIVLLSGCSPSPVANDNGTGPSENDNSFEPGPPLTEEQRESLYTSIDQHVDKHRLGVSSVDSAALMQDLAATDDIVDAGVSEDGSVWAHMSDGRQLVIVNNTFVGARVSELSWDTPTTERSASKDVPNPVAWSVNGLGPPNVAEIIEDMLGYYGYAVPGTSDPTIAQWRSSMEEMGVFHIETHGMPFLNVFGQADYAVFMNIEQSRQRDVEMLVDLDDRSVIVGWNPDGSRTYAITADFIKKYMSFSSGVVFMNSCCSGSDAASRFAQACFDKGAAAYYGWDGTVLKGDAEAAAAYAFSIGLGNTQTVRDVIDNVEFSLVPDHPEPPFRPFTMDSIFRSDAPSKPDGFPVSNSDSYTAGGPYDQSVVDGRVVELILNRNVFGSDIEDPGILLRPSISYLEVDEADGQLKIHLESGGGVGSPGAYSVTVGGVDVTGTLSLEEMPDALIVEIDSSAAGEVQVVSYDGSGNPLLSNRRWLTRFSDFDVTSTFRFHDHSGRYITQRWEGLSFRGDIQTSRARIFADVDFPSRDYPLFVEEGASFSYEVGGMDDLDNNLTQAYASLGGSASFETPSIDGLSENSFTVYVALLGHPPYLTLEPSVHIPDAFKVVNTHTFNGDELGMSILALGGPRVMTVPLLEPTGARVDLIAGVGWGTITSMDADPDLNVSVEWNLTAPGSVHGWPDADEPQ
jgi:hypothetical protein